MNNIAVKGFTSLTLLVCVTCSQNLNNDALSIYEELDQDSEANILSAREKRSGWILLFDGSTAAGWRGYNMDSVPDCWIIEDGSMTTTAEGMAESQEGIITNKNYVNFALSAEFKLSWRTNSGILYQVNEDPKYTYPYETGPEIQVIDHQNWPDPLEDWQLTGANYAMYPPLKKPYKSLGEWNHLLLIVNGNHVTQMLNGEIIVQFEKYSEEWIALRNSGKWSDFPDYGKFDEGHITLQNHGTRVWYRNLKLKEI